MSRRTQVLIAIAAALAAVLVIVKLAGGGSHEEAASVETTKPVALASAARPEAPSIQNQLVVQPRWTRQAAGDATAADFAHAPLVAPAAAAPLRPTEAQKVAPPAVQPNEVMHQLPSKATADGAAARAEDKFGPLSKRERMALERQVQSKKQADRVPGTAQMRQNLLKNQCTGPQAQKDYQQLTTEADRAAFRRRCASFGFQPAP